MGIRHIRISSGLQSFLKEEVRIGDWVVLAFFLCVCVFSFAYIYSGKGVGKRFQVIVSGKKTGVFPLSEDGVKVVQTRLGRLVVRVSGGSVFVESAPCKKKVCMGMGAISREGEVVVCAPGGVIIEVVGGEKRPHSELDGITK